MSVLLLPVLFVIQAQDPTELKSRVIDASVFKSGLVMLTREVTVPAGEGFYRLDAVPEALDGTFWYRSPDPVSLGDIETVLRIKERKEKRPAASMMDLLAANMGKKVTMTLQRYGTPPTTERITAEIVTAGAANFGGQQILFKLENGDFRAVGAGEIMQMDAKGIETQIERTVKVPELHLRFRAKADKPARLQFVTMETGAAWTGSYLIGLLPDMKAKVEGKAQLGVGGLKFADTTVSAMAGAPNLPQQARFDLSAGYGSLMAYLSRSQERYQQYRPGPVDPYTLLPTLNQQYQAYGQYGYISNQGGFGGGMGGGGFGGGLANDAISFDAADNSLIMNRPGNEGQFRAVPTDAEAQRVEGLYSYPLGKLNLEPGDRMTRMLFSQTAPYTRLFTWAAETTNRQVRDVLRLTNTSKMPWTGGMAFVVKENTPLAQVPLQFTAIGKTVDLELGMANDVLVNREDRQLKIEDVTLPEFPRQVTKRSITEGKLTIENTRDAETRLEATTVIEGEVVSGGGAQVTPLARQVDSYNWQKRLNWTVNLKPGERKEIVFTFSRTYSTGIRGL